MLMFSSHVIYLLLADETRQDNYILIYIYLTAYTLFLHNVYYIFTSIFVMIIFIL